MTGPSVAYQGEPGAFSEEAARRLFGPEMRGEPRAAFTDVVDAVLAGSAEYGVLPVENTLAGGVATAFDVLDRDGLCVIGETRLPIRLCVLGLPGAAVAGLRAVRSHPVALAQCGRWLAAHPHLRGEVGHDTAGAAREVAGGADPAIAAIAGAAAAMHYGLDILARDIQDRPDNQTRFFALAPVPRGGVPAATPAGPRKSVLVVETPHRPGALLAVLQPFAGHGANLTHLESRPAGDPWHYRFFLEVVDADGAAPGAWIEEVRSRCRRLRVLGAFPA